MHVIKGSPSEDATYISGSVLTTFTTVCNVSSSTSYLSKVLISNHNSVPHEIYMLSVSLKGDHWYF